MSKAMVPMNTKVPREMAKALDTRAKRHGVSRSWLVRRYLETVLVADDGRKLPAVPNVGAEE